MKTKTNFFKANFIYLIILFAFVAIRIISSTDLLSFMGDYGSYIMNIILQIGLMLVLPLVLYPKLRGVKIKQNANDFGFKKVKFSVVLIAFGIGILVYILNIGVSSFFSYILSLLGYEKFTSTTVTDSYPFYMLIINLIFTAVLPAICEETTHRGMLLHGYKGLGFKRALIISSLLFGLTHLNIDQFFYATIIGLLLGFITCSCSNIVPAIIIHFTNNAISVLITYFMSVSTKFASSYSYAITYFSRGNALLTLPLLFVIIACLLALLAYLVYLLFKKTAIDELNNVAGELTKEKLRSELMGEQQQPVNIQNSVPVGVEFQNKRFKVYIPLEKMGYPLKKSIYPSKLEKTLMFACICLSSLVTLFTFIWGVI